MFEIMLAILLAVGSAMPKNMVSNTSNSTIITPQDGTGDTGHNPPTPPPPPIP